MIEYIKLFWEGAPDGEPAVILYEVDTENEWLVLRSIDIFADGRTRNIPDLYDGAIEITPIPTVDELNAHVWGEEFHACVIEKAEFESIWETHTYRPFRARLYPGTALIKQKRRHHDGT